MAVGFAVAEANAALTNRDLSGDWLKLHTGDPGANGTANAADNTVRKQVTLGTPANGQQKNSAEVEWEDVGTIEHYTHGSLWTAETGGDFRMSGTITANPILTENSDFTIPVDGFVVKLNVAA